MTVDFFNGMLAGVSVTLASSVYVLVVLLLERRSKRAYRRQVFLRRVRPGGLAVR